MNNSKVNQKHTGISLFHSEFSEQQTAPGRFRAGAEILRDPARRPTISRSQIVSETFSNPSPFSVSLCYNQIQRQRSPDDAHPMPRQQLRISRRAAPCQSCLQKNTEFPCARFKRRTARKPIFGENAACSQTFFIFPDTCSKLPAIMPLVTKRRKGAHHYGFQRVGFERYDPTAAPAGG